MNLTAVLKWWLGNLFYVWNLSKYCKFYPDNFISHSFLSKSLPEIVYTFLSPMIIIFICETRNN